MRRMFGSPPQTIEEWLTDYIAETEGAKRRSLFHREWLKGRVSGLKSALNLLRLEREQGRVRQSYRIVLSGDANYPYHVYHGDQLLAELPDLEGSL